MRAARLCICICLLVVAASCTKTPVPSRPKATFVKAQGTSLVLDGKPYRFHGLNYYDFVAFSQENPYNPGHQLLNGCRRHTQVPVAAETLPRMGAAANVVRAFFLQPYATAVPLGGGPSSRDWSVFDRALDALRASKMKAIIAFSDQYGNCDLPNKQVHAIDWYRSRYRTEVVPGELSTYRHYVREIVTRYRDRPEILAWQLITEAGVPNADGSCHEAEAARVLRAFVDDVAGLVKRIDRNHLVSIGTGRRGCGIEGPNRRSYAMVFSSPYVDLCEYHDYDYPNDPLPPVLKLLLQICGNQLIKPLFVGEAGMTQSKAHPGCSKALRFTACRARLLEAKARAQFDASAEGYPEDVVGFLVWSWCEPLWTRCDSTEFDIVPEDPVLSALARLPES